MKDLTFWLNQNRNNLEFMQNKLEDQNSNGEYAKISTLIPKVLEMMEVLIFYVSYYIYFLLYDSYYK